MLCLLLLSTKTTSDVVASSYRCIPIHSIPSSHASITNFINNKNICNAYNNRHNSAGILYTLGFEFLDVVAIINTFWGFFFFNGESRLEPSHCGTASMS
jgi:hypothetical protein